MQPLVLFIVPVAACTRGLRKIHVGHIPSVCMLAFTCRESEIILYVVVYCLWVKSTDVERDIAEKYMDTLTGNKTQDGHCRRNSALSEVKK